ncbi:hypothetical protein PWT90_09724 [Aphanocladium album]|nr:hypothetical protein PWT90_09724 [Aphanocladium album]
MLKENPKLPDNTVDTGVQFWRGPFISCPQKSHICPALKSALKTDVLTSAYVDAAGSAVERLEQRDQIMQSHHQRETSSLAKLYHSCHGCLYDMRMVAKLVTAERNELKVETRVLHDRITALENDRDDQAKKNSQLHSDLESSAHANKKLQAICARVRGKRHSAVDRHYQQEKQTNLHRHEINYLNGEYEATRRKCKTLRIDNRKLCEREHDELDFDNMQYLYCIDEDPYSSGEEYQSSAEGSDMDEASN